VSAWDRRYSDKEHYREQLPWDAFPTFKQNSPTMLLIHESEEAVSFAVKVHPRAKKNAITGEFGDALKVSLTAPPLEGRANEACIEFFARILKVPRSSVTIASGAGGRNKVIRVAGVTAQYVRDSLRG
jgi:uncharacterized protein